MDHQNAPASTQVNNSSIVDELDVSISEAIHNSNPKNATQLYLTTEVTRDEWLGQQYLNCVIGHCVLSSITEPKASIDMTDELTSVMNGFDYKACIEKLAHADIRSYTPSDYHGHQINNNRTGTDNESQDHRNLLTGWVGAIARRGSPQERKRLLFHLREPFAASLDPHDHDVAGMALESTGEIHQQQRQEQDNTLRAGNNVNVDTVNDNHATTDLYQRPIITPTTPLTANNTSTAAPVPLTEPQPSADPTSRETERAMSLYTSALTTYVNKRDQDLDLIETQVQILPRPLHRAVIRFQGHECQAQTSRKKLSKHMAAKEMCERLGIRVDGVAGGN